MFPALQTRGGAAVWNYDFLFAVEAPKITSVSVALDGQPPVPLKQLAASAIWYRLDKLPLGKTHRYQFFGDGKPMGNNFQSDVPGYNPDSYPQPGVPRGTMSEKKTITSKIYPEMTANYWVYSNPGIDTGQGAPLMIWQDGENIVGLADLTRVRLQIVSDNLVHQKVIPPMVHVLISPGDGKEGQGTRMRSIQYDTVSDRYGRYLLEEVLPEVQKQHKLRPDAYSRAIAGQSSGAICAFNAAWYFPSQFSRVLSHIGSYVALQYRPDERQDGGNIIPFRVSREQKKNIRIWLSDGADDQETRPGSWPLQNILLANSLKGRGYDYHFRFGSTLHNSAQGALDLPESLTWLWRDYDPAKTEQVYEQNPAEKGKPPYRVRIANREAW
jgi:enterochelin esterase-like enzyme